MEPGIGTIPGSCASSQASAICAGVASFRPAMRSSNTAPGEITVVRMSNPSTVPKVVGDD